MGLGVWALSGRLEWNWRSRRFLTLHAVSLVGFAAVYATSWTWPDIVTGHGAAALASIRSSPILVWNLLMGTWLYLLVAGFSYAIRAQRRARAGEAAAAEARLMAQQAQLAALRARLNPHFLYNALHSVGALVGSRSAPRGPGAGAAGRPPALRARRRGGGAVPARVVLHPGLPRLRAAPARGAAPGGVPGRARGGLRAGAAPHPAAAGRERGPPWPGRSAGGRSDRARRTHRGKAAGAHRRRRWCGEPAGEGTGIGVSSVRERLRVIYGDAASVEAGPRGRGFGVTLRLPVRRADGELAA